MFKIFERHREICAKLARVKGPCVHMDLLFSGFRCGSSLRRSAKFITRDPALLFNVPSLTTQLRANLLVAAHDGARAPHQTHARQRSCEFTSPKCQ